MIKKGRKNAFTLAEVLITLAIIGVVAAMAIPSVISNAQQQEFKTGLRKAVSVLNSAITMNIALDGESPYDNKDLFRYLVRHMSVMSSTDDIKTKYVQSQWRQLADGSLEKAGENWTNAVFYTTDGMRFEFHASGCKYPTKDIKMHEDDAWAHICLTNANPDMLDSSMGCGSYGLISNPNNTTKTPCLLLVDVNGDRKPTPANINCQVNVCPSSNNKQIFLNPGSKKVSDIFGILITEDRAIPFGVLAQKAMYQAQK